MIAKNGSKNGVKRVVIARWLAKHSQKWKFSANEGWQTIAIKTRRGRQKVTCSNPFKNTKKQDHIKRQKETPVKRLKCLVLQGSPGVHDRIRTCGPSAPEADALSSWATWTYSILMNAENVAWTYNLRLRSWMRWGQARCSGGTYSIQLSYMDIFSFFDALMPTWILSIPPRAFFSEGLLVSSGGERSIQLSYGRKYIKLC